MANEKAEAALKTIEKLGGCFVWEPELFIVSLCKARITDKDLELFADLQAVSMLDLSNPSITDAGLEHLHSLTELRHLSLVGANVTDAGVAKLQAALPGLEINRNPPPKGWKNPFGPS